MSKQLSSLVVVVLATAFGLLCPAGSARADAITVGKASQVTGTNKVQGSGTYSLNAGRKIVANSFTMNVRDLKGNLVGSGLATLPGGTTEWSAVTKNPLPPGTYNVSATMQTTDAMGGDLQTIDSQNSIQVTIP